MDFAICRLGAGSVAGNALALERSLRWLKFGTDYFIYSVDATRNVDWEALGSPTGAPDMAVMTSGRCGASLPYLVKQKGRSFQRTYPDVPVLLDKGRHLVVQLDPARAGGIASRPALYSIRPAPENAVVVARLERPATLRRPAPLVSNVVDTLNRDCFANTLRELASFPTRHSLTRHFLAAGDHLADELRQMGYAVSLQTFTIPGGETRNIIADKLGTAGGARGQTLVVAHLDSINHPSDESQPVDPMALAPGADDNGSGCAGLMEIARVLHDQPFPHDLRLILFGGEEQDLLGSKHFLSRLSIQERARIRAVLNMDMIAVANGTQGPAVLLEGGDLVSRQMIEDLSAAAQIYTGLTVDTSFDPYASDHVPFIKAGIPATLTIEGNDVANPNDHTADDTLAHINHDLALEILRMNTAFVATAVGL